MFITPRPAANPLPTGHTIPLDQPPDDVLSPAALAVPAHHHGQVCGCPHTPPDTITPAGVRPQLHISTGGIVAIAVGGVFLVVTVGVILASLLLTIALVAGALAVMALAMAIVAMSLRSVASTDTTTRRKERK